MNNVIEEHMQNEMCCRCCEATFSNRGNQGVRTRGCYGRKCPCWIGKHGCETCREECVNKQEKWDKKNQEKTSDAPQTEDKTTVTPSISETSDTTPKEESYPVVASHEGKQSDRKQPTRRGGRGGRGGRRGRG